LTRSMAEAGEEEAAEGVGEKLYGEDGAGEKEEPVEEAEAVEAMEQEEAEEAMEGRPAARAAAAAWSGLCGTV